MNSLAFQIKQGSPALCFYDATYFVSLFCSSIAIKLFAVTVTFSRQPRVVINSSNFSFKVKFGLSLMKVHLILLVFFLFNVPSLKFIKKL